MRRLPMREITVEASKVATLVDGRAIMRPFVTIGEEAADTTKAVRPLVEEEIEHHRPMVGNGRGARLGPGNPTKILSWTFHTDGVERILTGDQWTMLRKERT